MVIPGVSPHIQGNRQLPLFFKRFNNLVFDSSVVELGDDVSVMAVVAFCVRIASSVTIAESEPLQPDNKSASNRIRISSVLAKLIGFIVVTSDN